METLYVYVNVYFNLSMYCTVPKFLYNLPVLYFHFCVITRNHYTQEDEHMLSVVLNGPHCHTILAPYPSDIA